MEKNQKRSVCRISAVFGGEVQGVGFRRAIVAHAEKLGIVGTVRNLENGSVELIAESEKQTLDLLLKSIQERPGSAKIREIKIRYLKPLQIYSDFQIIK